MGVLNTLSRDCYSRFMAAGSSIAGPLVSSPLHLLLWVSTSLPQARPSDRTAVALALYVYSFARPLLPLLCAFASPFWGGVVDHISLSFSILANCFCTGMNCGLFFRSRTRTGCLHWRRCCWCACTHFWASWPFPHHFKLFQGSHPLSLVTWASWSLICPPVVGQAFAAPARLSPRRSLVRLFHLPIASSVFCVAFVVLWLAFCSYSLSHPLFLCASFLLCLPRFCRPSSFCEGSSQVHPILLLSASHSFLRFLPPSTAPFCAVSPSQYYCVFRHILLSFTALCHCSSLSAAAQST